MFFPRTAKAALPRLTCALAACLLFAIANSALAQHGPGGGRARGGGGGGPKPPPTVGPIQKKPVSTVGEQPGSFRGQISKWELGGDAKDENLIGTLTIRPVEKGAKSIKLQVRRADEQAGGKNDCIALGSHPFDADAYGDVLWKGLYCEVTWDWLHKEGDPEKKKPTIRELKKLTFDTLSVEGKIEEMEGEFLIIKVRPAAGRDWPDADTKEAPMSSQPKKAGGAATAKQVVAKKLRLKVFDDVTTFLDAAKQPLDVGDFAVDQQIEAVVVYGKKDGILVELKSLTAEEKKEGESGAAKPGGPTPRQPAGPQPRGGGPRPRGR